MLGLDLPDPTAGWYGEIFELFGVRRVISRINPFVPLPDMGPRFDYVCGFMVCFNRHASPEEWNIEEWRFFLDDLRTRLKPGAIVWLELNPGLNGGPLHAGAAELFSIARRDCGWQTAGVGAG